MTSAFGSIRSPDRSDVAPLRRRSGWIIALGAVYIIAGVVALGSIMLATVASVFVVGVMMLISGIAEMIGAFPLKSWGKFLLWMLLGALYVIAGAVALANPLLAALTLTLVLGVVLIISGATRIALALAMPHGTRWEIGLLSGVVTAFIGAIIVAQWPVSSVYTLGFVLGVDLLFAGAGWLALGLALRAGSGINVGPDATRPA